MIYLIDPQSDLQIARFEQITYGLLAGRLMAIELKKPLELREGEARELVATFSEHGQAMLE